jgi:hypothetical protein
MTYRNLCRGCGVDFASVSAFDRHRTGTYVYTFAEGLELDPPQEDGRRCLDVDEPTPAWPRMLEDAGPLRLTSNGLGVGSRRRLEAGLQLGGEADLDWPYGTGRREVRRERAHGCRLLQRLSNLRHNQHRWDCGRRDC